MIRACPRTPSVAPGDALTLHVATDSARFRVAFYRWEDGSQLVHRSGWLPGKHALARGPDPDWDWPSCAFAIPDDWASSVYIAEFEEEGRKQSFDLARDSGATLFVVRAAARAAVHAAVHASGARADGYIVQQAGHWVFAGTELNQGASFGQRSWPPLTGYECDGLPLDAFEDGTRAVLSSRTRVHAAALRLFERNGTVFSSGGTDWAQVLAGATATWSGSREMCSTVCAAYDTQANASNGGHMVRRPLLQRLDPQSVVVFRALHLGDMLCAVPALRALRNSLPRAHIAVVGLPWAQQFADRFPGYIDEFISFPGHPMLPEQPVNHAALADFYAGLCARQFALAIQLHGNGDVSNDIVSGFGASAMAGFCHAEALTRERTVLLPYPETGAEPERLLSLMKQLGADVAGAHLEFPLTRLDEDELAASGIGKDLVPGEYFCIHPGARKRDKCWPAALFADVGDRIAAEFGLRPVLTGSGAETDLTAQVASRMHHKPLDAASPISIGAMAVLLRGARLLLCNDTGVSHIAAGLKLKSVVIFSKADIARWAPLDRLTHRCIWDPAAERAAMVLQHARALLSGTAPSRQRCVGMWPYW